MTNPYNLTDIYKALAKAQGEFPPIPKDKTVRVKTKTGGFYEYSYADLTSIINLIRPVLTKNDLGFYQSVSESENKLLCVTTLFHGSGQTIYNQFPMTIREEGMQALGGVLTFAKRYGLTALLGISTDEDTDAGEKNEANKNNESPKILPPNSTIQVRSNTNPKGDYSRPAMSAKDIKVDEQKIEGNNTSGPTEAQLKRYWALFKKSGWKEEELKLFLKDKLNTTSSKALTSNSYKIICDLLERKVNFNIAINR